MVSGGDANDFHVARTTDGNFVIMKDVVYDSTFASAVNIGLIKTDADFNPMWVKQYSVEREVSGYGLQPTSDKGVVVVGSMLTTKMRYVMGTLEPYTEAALIKSGRERRSERLRFGYRSFGRDVGRPKQLFGDAKHEGIRAGKFEIENK